MTQHIICVGAVYIDTILSVRKFPIEDQKLRASKHARRRGGNGANTLEVLSQLVFKNNRDANSDCSKPGKGPIRLHLISALPNKQSAAVKFICDSLKHVNINDSCIFQPDVSEAASSYIIQNELNNSRTIVSHNDVPEMTTEEFIEKAIQVNRNEGAQQGWYHFEGRIPDVTKESVEYLRRAKEQAGFKVSVECEKPEREYMAVVAKLADVVFYSKLWVQTKGYDNPRKFLDDQLRDTKPGALLCCTWGDGGATIVQKAGSGNKYEWATVDAWTPGGPSQVVDTVGAGDTFIAGMLYALTRYTDDWNLQQKLEFANELAGRKVIQDGFTNLVAQLSPHN